MAELDEVIDALQPLPPYDEYGELESDVQRLVLAENPRETAATFDAKYGQQADAHISIDDVEAATEEELKQAMDEWDRVKESFETRYKARAEYFQWEYRRAYLLERLAGLAASEFGTQESTVARRHRITVEVSMWAAYAKHLLLSIDTGSIGSAEDEFGFLDVSTKHGISEAIMTTSSVYESVGREVLAQNHRHDHDDHLTMSDINAALHQHGYVDEFEERLVDQFRSNLRNDTAHDIIERSRYDRFNDFRREVIKPCWEVITLAQRLVDAEIDPDE